MRIKTLLPLLLGGIIIAICAMWACTKTLKETEEKPVAKSESILNPTPVLKDYEIAGYQNSRPAKSVFQHCKPHFRTLDGAQAACDSFKKSLHNGCNVINTYVGLDYERPGKYMYCVLYECETGPDGGSGTNAGLALPLDPQ